MLDLLTTVVFVFVFMAAFSFYSLKNPGAESSPEKTTREPRE